MNKNSFIKYLVNPLSCVYLRVVHKFTVESYSSVWFEVLTMLSKKLSFFNLSSIFYF